jgi:hypothetical protein
MALSAFAGSFTVPSSTGNLAVTGVGFQPKAVIFFGNLWTVAGIESLSGATKAPFYYGMATSSSARGVVACENAGGTPSPITDSASCILSSSTGTVNFKADFVTMDADGFTVNFSTANATASLVIYLALGGSDLNNAFVKSWTAPTSTGNNAQTGVGFKPDCLFIIGADNGASGSLDSIDVGMVSSASARGATSDSIYNTGVQNLYQRTTKVFVDALNGTVNKECDLVSFDSDGFTLNWTTAAANTVTLFALCMKGGLFKAGSLLQKTSTGTQATAGIGFIPTGLLLMSGGQVASSTVTASPSWSMLGAATGDFNRAVVMFQEYSNVSTSDALDYSNVYEINVIDSTSLAGQADLSSFDSNGFTLNYGTADATAREILYLAFGSAPFVDRARGGSRPFPFSPGY